MFLRCAAPAPPCPPPPRTPRPPGERPGFCRAAPPFCPFSGHKGPTFRPRPRARGKGLPPGKGPVWSGCRPRSVLPPKGRPGRPWPRPPGPQPASWHTARRPSPRPAPPRHRPPAAAPRRATAQPRPRRPETSPGRHFTRRKWCAREGGSNLWEPFLSDRAPLSREFSRN